ncbi:MAG: endonuclease/exonuclease/phosphatase [Niabella sp.]
MKNLFYWILLLSLFAACKKTVNPASEEPVTPQPPVKEDSLKDFNKDITIANWNIEWFGSSVFGGNLDVQQANAEKVLKYLDADLYGLCEIVDTARFGRMIRGTFGDDYRYDISPYPSMLNAQRLAFVYNRHIFRKVKVRPFLGLSISATKNFASGRYPFLLQAQLSVNGQIKDISVILLHAKANADNDSYNRRLNGAREMKDTLDKDFANKSFLIIGDFNDHLNGSILNGMPSPYQDYVNDNTRYLPITYPLNTTGYQSTLSYVNSVIDQQVISTAMGQWYVSASAKIRTDVTTPVPNFTTRNTSDHYPVTSVYHVR